MTSTFEMLLVGVTPPGVFAWLGDGDRDLGAQARAAGWQARRIDTCQVRTADQLYDEIVEAWDLPGWFGRNLDALWDVLADLAVGPLLIVWDGRSQLAEANPDLARTLLELLGDASREAEKLAVVVRDRPADDAPEVSGLDGLL